MNTSFHKVKFGIEKAIYVFLKMSGSTKSISAEQLSKTIGVNRKTALLFQLKVRITIQSFPLYPFHRVNQKYSTHFWGQKEEGQTGLGAEEKAQIVVPVEKI